jgi:hypothetical protein
VDLREIEGAVEQTAPIPLRDGPDPNPHRDPGVPQPYLPAALTIGYDTSAAELVSKIRERGGRLFRMKDVEMVFVLTTDSELAHALVRMGGRYNGGGGYTRSRDPVVVEWDVWIHQIPVSGEATIWEAAA